jgi:RNA polymerase sigma-70 factor (ECF subfamily)
MPTAAVLAPRHAELPRPAVIDVGWADLMSHRAYLVRFAQRKLHDPSLAEDVVHDVFEAVLSGRASFAGASALRSWLTGVLKHKIVDLLRQRRSAASLDTCDGDDELALHSECPQPRPDEIAEQRELLRHALLRIAALPPGLRAVVELRVLHDQSSAQVCRSLRISQDNLFVRLHRARKQLLS